MANSYFDQTQLETNGVGEGAYCPIGFDFKKRSYNFWFKPNEPFSRSKQLLLW